MPVYLNRNPYFDDFSPVKDYYKMLFQPGVSVQVRELNQLQTMLQQQIERFGDHIFTSGTIVSGCNFQFYNPYPYIKIKDVEFDGTIAVPQRYLGYNILNPTSNLRALVVNFQDGFESTDPDLKTLYLTYNNAANTGNTFHFSAGDVLTVFDPVINGIEKVNITNGGTTFSNTDSLLAISALVLTVASGVLTPGDYLKNASGANVQIISVDSTSLASSNQSIVTVAPKPTDLANTAANSTFWTISQADAVSNTGGGLTATCDRTIGAGFTGRVTTDSAGKIVSTTVTQKGVGYTTLPYMTVRSLNNTGGYASLALAAQNYVTKVTVGSVASSVGNGYAFGVTEGVVYQKGYFLRVAPQQIIVSKYDQQPDNVAVGFITNENIVNYNIDASLLDNAADTLNEQAPGADRLQLVPSLALASSSDAAANAEFFTMAEWKEGRPYKQNYTTDYSTIGEELDRRTFESSGDFVTDPFLVTTRSPANTSNEGQFFNVVIDPGTAYIQGARVSTTANFNIDDTKGANTGIANSHGVSLNYGNYVIVNNLGGTFQFNVGDTVALYDTAKTFLNDTASIVAATLTPGGSQIGSANIRSLVHLDNEPGTSGATWKLYLFNILMNTGKRFADVRAVYYNGTKKGVADCVLETDPTTANSIAILKDTNNARLIFNAGVESLKNANSVTYNYRTCNSTLTSSNGNVSNATLVFDISAGSETFPYSGTLSSGNMQDMIVAPTSGDMVAQAQSVGTAATLTTSAVITGTTSTWLTDYAAGDWVTIAANSTGGSDLRKVVGVTNNTSMTLNANVSFANAVSKVFRTFPANVPVPFGYRSGLSANVNINQNILTFDYGMAFSFSGTRTTTLATNITRTNVTQLTKTPVRNRFVRLQMSNNAGGTLGPWSLGVPDAFRLRGAYVGNSTVSNTGSNFISNFYIDHNQNVDFYGLSYLYLSPKAKLTLQSSDFILVQFDYFTSSGVGFYDTVSYTQSSNQTTIFAQDSLALSGLTSIVNSFEVPEIFSDSGEEIDPLNSFDFRPVCSNTAAPATTPAAAPLNPSNTVTLDVATDKKFPVPDSTFLSSIEYYLGRTDSVFVDKSGGFTILPGQASADPAKRLSPNQPVNTLKLVDMVIPPYPNLPINYGVNIAQILDTHVANIKFANKRVKFATISTPFANTTMPFNQPRVYTMADVGNIDRRLKDVEYYVTLNTLETGAATKVVPSSVNPTLDRFKFGVFVDDFTSSQFSEITNPQYAAIKEGADIVPTKMKWDESLLGYGSGDFIESSIISQPDATVGDVTDPLGLGPRCALNLANTVAYVLKFHNADDVLNTQNPNGLVDLVSPASLIDKVNLTFADSAVVTETLNVLQQPLTQFLQTHQYDPYQFSGSQLLNFLNAPVVSHNYDAATQTLTVTFDPNHPVTFTIPGVPPNVAELFFQLLAHQITPQQFAGALQVVQSGPTGGTFVLDRYLPPVTLYFYNYDQGVKIEILQGTTVVATTDTAAVGVSTPAALTTDEITLLSGPNAGNWFNDYPGYFLKTFVDTGSGFVTYAGKLTFNYNTANGKNFTIRTTSSANSFRWRWAIAYPINGDSAGCIPPSISQNVQSTLSPVFATYQFNAYCGNGAADTGQVHMLIGYTSTWNFTPPTPTTVVGPFDITADWAGVGT